MQPRPDRYITSILILAALYVVAGRLGLRLDAVSGFATLVWPPTGISLAALLIFGCRLWPGVALGALTVNLWAGASLPLASGIALGNTLEAVAAAYALQRIPGFTPSLERLRDVLALILIAAALSSVLSATIGTTSLLLAGVVTPERFGLTWSAWWTGDAVADLIVAPLLLSWVAGRSLGFQRRRVLETVVVGVCLIIVSAVVFATDSPSDTFAFLQPYLLSPFLIWAALRFQLRGAATSIALVSTIAVWATAAGQGPFTTGELYQRLGALQAFMAITAITFLVLGAVAAERSAAERELIVAKDAAEAASRAKSRFLAVVSHELRTPLSGIVGYSELLLENIGGDLNERQNVYVSRIKAVAWHLVNIIDGILTFSRGEAGRDALRLETVDARSVVHETVALVAPQAAAKHLSIRLALPDTPVPMHTDPGKVRQILVNLVGNAVKFTNAGSIQLELLRDDTWVSVRVRDQGPGIPAHQLERIFEPFTQLSIADPQLPGGTGLGLAVTRMLAGILGGSVVVASQVGEGSTFTVTLPLTITPHPAPAGD